ncbi:Hsp20/alpha crystallin family protein [Lacimicrobium alkaliphilum]|uniref:Heat-shock protein Hsp20 n=1 Tax=Lacimicrobium alkaliphilum TaxID=1526571 RepID=A0ABQ1QY94_9ALTE|nr:Hsp20/alpha crystallin family protein [Lacimicrobium alkaliphilum]GGD49514.1 heat-shock protein Hsp20 [Lacimicrobium alkaliphilum]
MKLDKLNPWNWFKHEELQGRDTQIPVRRSGNNEVTGVTEHPVYPMAQLHQEIDRLFESAFRGVGVPGLAGNNLSSFRPSLDVSGDGSAYLISLETPGMAESDLDIEVSGDILRISGHKKEEKEDKDRHYYRIERNYGSFARTLSLPDDANADEIQVSLKDGILNLTIPRRGGKRPETRKIAISQ